MTMEAQFQDEIGVEFVVMIELLSSLLFIVIRFIYMVQEGER
jgi:hypothetical protein